jgi:hypothetical protein
VDWSQARRSLVRVRRARLITEYVASSSDLLGRPSDDSPWRLAPARVRLAIADSPLKRALAPADRIAGALDAGRLRRHYGTRVGGPWGLRVHHVRQMVRRVLT